MPRGRPKKPGPREPSGKASRAKSFGADGRALRTTRAEQEKVQLVALQARARQVGLTPTEATILAMKQPWMGCNAGRTISTEPDAAELWQTIQTIRQRRRAWLAVIGAPSEHAKTAKLMVTPNPPDPGTTVESISADPRSEAERERDADRAWSAIADALYSEDPLLLRFIERSVILDEVIAGPLARVLRLRSLQKAIGK